MTHPHLLVPTRGQFGRAVDRGKLDVPRGPQRAGGALEGAVEGLGRVGVAEHAPAFCVGGWRGILGGWFVTCVYM